MEELPDDLVYPTPPLNKEQLLDIEEIFKDLIHGGSAFESAPSSTKHLTDSFKSQNTPSGIDSGMYTFLYLALSARLAGKYGFY